MRPLTDGSHSKPVPLGKSEPLKFTVRGYYPELTGFDAA
jgi:hypothetical protein